MGLSAQDVHDKQFKLVRNSTGYDMDEVDAFLDEVEAEVARLNREVAAAQEQAGHQAEAANPDDASSAAAHLLAMAQRTADEYVADARRSADRLLVDAQQTARKAVKKLELRRRQLEDRVVALEAFEAEVRSRLTGYFESQLADLRALAEYDPAVEENDEAEADPAEEAYEER